MMTEMQEFTIDPTPMSSVVDEIFLIHRMSERIPMKMIEFSAPKKQAFQSAETTISAEQQQEKLCNLKIHFNQVEISIRVNQEELNELFIEKARFEAQQLDRISIEEALILLEIDNVDALLESEYAQK
jgi:hypothetical protein